jgi:hypothetical protein
MIERIFHQWLNMCIFGSFVIISKIARATHDLMLIQTSMVALGNAKTSVNTLTF